MQAADWEMPRGHLIEGRYVLVKRIGFGGMGAVYEAFDSKLERPVAIKFLDTDLVSDEESITRFQREAHAAGRIGHENICDVRDRGTSDGVPYIVMELLEGETLQELLSREEVLPAGRIAPVILGVLSALGAAHQVDIIHRDLKPDNIFLDRSQDKKTRVKLLDFGISKFLDDANSLSLTQTGNVIGTPWYMSPEQAFGRRDIDHRSDLWSAGVVLYEALTGEVPFRAPNYNELLLKVIRETPRPPRELKPTIRPQLEEVVLTALRKDRKDRFDSAASFARALKRAVLVVLD